MSSTDPRGASNSLILVLFFLSGLTGLSYEIVWIRLLVLTFGSTQFAITTVLVTFMAGLGIGSLLLGRAADRSSRPLLVYATLELLLGVYCLLSPSIFRAAEWLYPIISKGPHTAGFTATEFIISFLVLITPAILMGGTFPVVVKHLASSSGRVGLSTAVPYAINTLGAVAGCLLTGLFSLYLLGVKATVYAAGVADIIIGVLAFLIYSYRASTLSAVSAAGPLSGEGREAAAPGAERIAVISAFALSGFASLSYEVLWTRVFSLVLGSSVYAFTIMLATFLAGIGAGSIIFAPYADNRKNPLAWFAALEAVIGLASILSIFVYGELPFIFYSLKEAFAERFWLFLFIQFLLCASIMIIPTLCMGAVFPLAGKIYARRLKAVGKGVGEAYFFNTAGSIFGAFAGGFILIPVLGAQNGVIVTAGLNIAIACALLWAARMSPFAKAAASTALVAAFAISVIALPTWDQMMMTLGLYANPANKEEVQGLRARPPERLLFYKEGINAIITVREGGPDGGIISYQANGKQEARSINGKPPVAWSLLGHLPLLLHPGAPQEALVVGLGSGITLGGMERYPLASIDVVELEPAVVEAAGFFRESNNNALDDPRVKLHIADGRKFASLMTKKYDIIVSGVSDPWITGVSNLFTYEYFGELNERLEHDGVVALWFQNYRVTPRELKTGLNTFASVFPYASVWFHYTDALDLIVIGSKEPLKFDMARISEATSSPSVKEGLRKIDINGPFDIVDLFLIGGSDLRGYIAGSPLNTDERPLLEFTLPRLLYSDPSIGIKNIEELLSHAEDLTPPLTIAEGEKEEFYLGLGKTYNRSNFRLPQSLKAFKKVLELNPGNKEAKYYIRGIEAELGSRTEN